MCTFHWYAYLSSKVLRHKKNTQTNKHIKIKSYDHRKLERLRVEVSKNPYNQNSRSELALELSRPWVCNSNISPAAQEQQQSCKIFIPPHGTLYLNKWLGRRWRQEACAESLKTKAPPGRTPPMVIVLSVWNQDSLWPVMAALTNTLTLSNRNDERG